MVRFDIITLFPKLFSEHLNVLPLKRAIEKGAASVNLVDLRKFAIDGRGSVDDKTYGGGVGMILRPEPIFEAAESIPEVGKRKIVLLSPKGKKFTQKMAEEFAGLDQVVFICGRYEGVDARVEEGLADEVISVGDYVLSGGELPAMIIMEAVARLLPGVLEKEGATSIESFSGENPNGVEYPQYTRPEEYRGMKVPDVLLSGNHKEIEKWRKTSSIDL